jgi:hypothetical protein
LEDLRIIKSRQMPSIGIFMHGYTLAKSLIF